MLPSKGYRDRTDQPTSSQDVTQRRGQYEWGNIVRELLVRERRFTQIRVMKEMKVLQTIRLQKQHHRYEQLQLLARTASDWNMVEGEFPRTG